MTIVNWDETKVRLKQRISALTDGNLIFVHEKQERLIGRLEVKLGQTREAIMKIISRM